MVSLDSPERRVPGPQQREDALWHLSGCVQASRAYGSASLQVGEPAFTIKAENLSLLGPNSSRSEADV